MPPRSPPPWRAWRSRSSPARSSTARSRAVSSTPCPGSSLGVLAFGARRGRADPAAQAARRGRRQPGRGRDARRPVRAPAAAAGGVPRPLAVRPAAVPGDLGPHDDPLVRRRSPGSSSWSTRSRWSSASGCWSGSRRGSGWSSRSWRCPLADHHAGAGAPLLASPPAAPRTRSGDLATVVEESALGIRVLKSLGRGRRLTARGSSPTPAGCAAPS